MPVQINLVGGFNTQPPEGGWPPPPADEPLGLVSTHSRPKAAGCEDGEITIKN